MLSQVGSVIEEIGYGVLTEFSGKGIGTTIVRLATEISKAVLLIAWVSEKNRASERCFEKNGFRKLSVNEERTLSTFDKPHFFYCWTKEIK